MNSSEIEPSRAGQLGIEAQEAALLGYLCRADGEDGGLAETLSALREYRFTTMHHQVLFDCLKQLPAGRPEIIAAELPARLVRAGFPDFDLRSYLTGAVADGVEARRICRRLMKQGVAEAGAAGV